jgi:hypothetical protein
LRVKNRAFKWLNRLGQNPLLREGAPLLGLYWVYSLIRWFVAQNSPYEAFENAFRVIQLERRLGIFYEPMIQSGLLDHARFVVHVANWFYTLGYFPILILAAALLYRIDQARFRVFKRTFMLGLGLALMCYSLFPLAPPRMLPEVGFVDTQALYGSDLYNHKSIVSFYNPYAAMPSLHFGWALLVGIMACTFGRLVLKALGVLYPSFMAMVIVTTGHHFFLDIAVGGLVIGLALSVVKAIPLMKRVPIPAGIGASAATPRGRAPSKLKASRRSAPSTLMLSGSRRDRDPMYLVTSRLSGRDRRLDRLLSPSRSHRKA